MTSRMPRLKQWTPRSSAFLALLICAGCGSPVAKLAVSVNVSQVVQQSLPPAEKEPSLPRAPKPLPGVTAVLPALPAREIMTRPQNAEELRESVRKLQESIRVRLEKQLRKLYARDVKRYEVELQRQFGDLEESSLTELSESIRAELEKVGAERLPKVSRLAFLAGWPDPNPQNTPSPTPLRPVPQLREEEALQLRKDLARIDAEFKARIENMSILRLDALAQRRTQILLAIELRKNELDAQANAEANKQVADATKDFQLDLARGQVIKLRPVAAESVTIPGGKPLAEVPKVPSSPELSEPQLTQSLVESDLRIWVGLNGFELKKGAVDKTAEFIAWRNSQKLGR